MSEDHGQSDQPVSDEMSEYLQMFVDETEEQLEQLVESLLVLEREPHNQEELNEAFRLIHTIKGSAGMMGLDNIAVLTHSLETRFEGFRAGLQTLDNPTMNLVLRCIDFLRECARRLRAGEELGSAADLLRELTHHEPEAPIDVRRDPSAASPDEPVESEAAPLTSSSDDAGPPPTTTLVPHDENAMRVAVLFDPGLPLVDLKVRLIVSRLSALGEIRSTSHDVDALSGVKDLARFEVALVTAHAPDAIRDAVDLDGVQSVEMDGAEQDASDATAPEPVSVSESKPDPVPDAAPAPVEAVADASLETHDETPSDSKPHPVEPDPVTPAAASLVETHPPPPDTERPTPSERMKPKVAETMRVDIDRLNQLMNLAGELVVNRARFVQIATLAAPSFRTRHVTGRVRDFGETLRKTIAQIESMPDANGAWTAHIQELSAGLGLLEEQSELWENGRKCFGQIGEAIDQLTRISDSLQQGVLDTRMVPIAPLFNRFNRVVRDLSHERGKRVDLRIEGEKTELDKRMIDELGDPLVHLVRNSIDHGLEPPEVRLARGKSEIGTICLEASHRGNNVHVSIRDDGGGIDLARVRAKIVERGLLSDSGVERLSDAEALDYIWHAGFSTAGAVTDISGRGVGMDVVRTRIADLNGTVDVESIPEVGTTFTIRLPLTLAIINSLLIRVRNIIFSMPIEDVREIVSVRAEDVVSLRGKQSIDVRGEYIPLVGIDDLFDWNDTGDGKDGGPGETESGPSGGTVAAVILQAGERTMGLRVDELLGSQDIVIKSLAENFVEIRGLSGASILGDGTVCLMLDVATLIDMAVTAASGGQLLEGTRA